MRRKDKKANEQHDRTVRSKRRLKTNISREYKPKAKKPIILIVCDGVNTEPSYFDKFKLKSATIKSVGTGRNTKSMVEKAINIKEAGVYDKVWCVFDKDDFDNNNFNEAINLANVNDIEVAYSNQAFEYWLMLHFENHLGDRMHRDDYNIRLNNHLKPLGAEYDGGKNGSKKVTKKLFDLLNEEVKPKTETEQAMTRTDLAIKRAKDICKYHDDNNLPPAKAESSTTVYKLVEEIMKHI